MLMAIVVVIIAQLLFTYAPFMHALFDSRPLRLSDGVLIVVISACLFLAL